MDRLEKFLQKIDSKVRARARTVIVSILANDLKGLNIKPMHGHKGYFRCRVGSIRFIFVQLPNGRNEIVDVGFRGDIYKRWK